VPGFTTALPYVVWTQPNGSSLTSPDAHIVLVADSGLSVTFDLPGVVLGDVVLLQPGESGFVLYRVRSSRRSFVLEDQCLMTGPQAQIWNHRHLPVRAETQIKISELRSLRTASLPFKITKFFSA
jgi:hypothetical protein